MAKDKKPTRYLSGKVEMKATFSQLRDKKEKKGPRQLGQQKNLFTAHMGKISQPQLLKRLDAAKSVLETGRVPAAVKGGTDKTKEATIQGREKALQKDLDAALARIEELESYAKPDADPPVEPEIKEGNGIVPEPGKPMDQVDKVPDPE